MQGSIDAARRSTSRAITGDQRLRVVSTRASLIDTRLVRVELARRREAQ
jgi:hypothetical protein